MSKKKLFISNNLTNNITTQINGGKLSRKSRKSNHKSKKSFSKSRKSYLKSKKSSGKSRKSSRKGNKLNRKNKTRKSFRRIRKSRRKNLFRKKKGPPNGIITKAWIKKECPCRDGDNCIPCPSDLKKYKDGRKK